MKTKKVLLGGLVLVFAAGSVLASAFSPINPKVEAYLTQADELSNNITCVTLSDITCEDTGSEACRIELQVTSGGNQTDVTFDDTNCTNRLGHILIPAEVSIQSVYSLVQPN